MTNRFDLESQIMNNWNVVEDLHLLYRKACNGELSQDEWSNALLGMYTLYNLKFQELFDTFSDYIKKEKPIDELPWLTEEEILEVSKSFGQFKEGDEYGDKRLQFGRAILYKCRTKFNERKANSLAI